MNLAPGTRLGPYEIVAPLGAGGMGEVWRARDTRLGREVAIKVLPAAFAADPSLRARIDREAKTISALNHPNICTLHDVGREGDVDYLVLELVEGETLALRIARGPLPLAEVLRYGIQVADALERAHRAGIVHRDLKPGNIMITKSGAKLLDFGLARGQAPGADEAAVRNTISPTMAEPLTREGHIVGTFQYMAPEQLEGADADPRSDLWALGCVLYEMATGRAPFIGGSQASLISAIMKDTPRPLAELVPLSPPALDRAVAQCLAKDPEERWQTAGDLRRELAWISSSGSQVGAVGPAAPASAARRATLPRLVRSWVPALLAGAAIVGLAWLVTERVRPASPLRLSIVSDMAQPLRDPAFTVLSPDGESVAYLGHDSTGIGLYVRRLSEPTSRVLVRSREQLLLPFWSPDSRHIAYFSIGENGKLWRVPADGGTPLPLAPSAEARGGTWNADGVILYAPEPAGPLFRIDEDGGVPVQATVLDTARGQEAHRGPQFLPDGDHFLYTGLPGTSQGLEIFAGSLRSGKSERVAVLPQTAPAYAEPGYLLYNREGKLVAQRFDARKRKLSGEPFIVADATDQTTYTGSSSVSASRNGRIAWRPNLMTHSRLEWVDHGGRTLSELETIDGSCTSMAIHPDGQRVLVSRTLSSGRIEVLAHDPDRGSMRRVSPGDFDSGAPVWAPDGASFYMSGNQGQGRNEIYRLPLTRASQPELVATTKHPFKRLRAITPDGRTLLYQALNPVTDWDVYRVDLDSGRAPEVIFGEPGWSDVALSPDGRTLAFRSQSSAFGEVFVAPFDRPHALKRLSPRVGFAIAWAPNGREFYYEQRDGEDFSVFAIPVDPSSGAATGPAVKLFTRPGISAWAPAPDGQRFLLSVRDRAVAMNEIRIDLDWPSLARRRVR